MTKSRAFRDLLRVVRAARFCDQHGLTTDDGFAWLGKRAERRRAALKTRREVLGGVGTAAVIGFAPWRRALAKRPPSVDVAIVGGGIAGLTCERPV